MTNIHIIPTKFVYIRKTFYICTVIKVIILQNQHIYLYLTMKTVIEVLDETDIRILRELQANARLPYKELGSLVNLSSTPVFERVKRLERDGYIKRYVTILDAEKLNKGFVVFCSVKLSPLNKKVAQEFCDTIRDIPEVTECYNISGQYDYLLKVHAPDMKYYQEFILNILGELPMLGSLTSTFVMEEIKNQFGVSL